MPKEFRFTINGEMHFRCKIKCIIGFEYCPAHKASILKLAIRDSKAAGPDGVVFRDGDRKTKYNGELVNAEELQERYDGYTAPYGVQVNARETIDCACKRGVGALGNTRPASNNATLVVDTRAKAASVKATRTIRNGQEVFISYGRSYRFDDETSHKTVPVK
eukprot:gene29597-35730_t